MSKEKKPTFHRIAVPVEVYRELKKQAAEQHRSLSGMLREWIAEQEERLERKK